MKLFFIDHHTKDHIAEFFIGDKSVLPNVGEDVFLYNEKHEVVTKTFTPRDNTEDFRCDVVITLNVK